MLTFAQGARLDSARSTSLPPVWQSWDKASITLRRGQVCMVAGAPGQGKTLLSLCYAVKAKVPTLLICADTDRATLLARMACAITGDTFGAVEKGLASNAGREYYLDSLAELGHIWMSTDSAPSIRDIDEELHCFAQIHGQYPHLLVIDNLVDLTSESDEGEWSGLRSLMKMLRRLSRSTGAAVMLLHHTSEQFENNGQPPPRSQIQGKVAQLPELILTCAIDPIGWLRVAAVKNRSGPADALARNPLTMRVDPARMQLEDMP